MMWFSFLGERGVYWVHASSWENGLKALHIGYPNEPCFTPLYSDPYPEYMTNAIYTIFREAYYCRAENCLGAPDYIE